MRPQHATTDKPQYGRKRICYQLGGSDKPKVGETIYMSEKCPIKLQRIFVERGVIAQDVGSNIINKNGVALSRSTISLVLNRGYMPIGQTPDFKEQMEAYLRGLEVPEDIIKTCWEREEKDNVVPIGSLTGRKKNPITLVEPSAEHLFEATLKEAEMLTPTTLRQFGLFRNPFIDDIQKDEDVYMSESHRYSLAAMTDAAQNGGFCAIVGECGAGKSVLRRKLIQKLQAERDVRVIYPQTIDKQYLTSNQILEAIVNDLSPDSKVRRTNEAKARQVRDLLLHSSQTGQRHVLLLEEAHDLTVATMKQLKRLWEIEDGYRKVLGIVLIGQTELAHRLNRQNHPEMREVILRCLISELMPLDADLESYMTLKFNRVDVPLQRVFENGWADAVRNRLTMRNGQTVRSMLYPLYIHNLLAAAMNHAAELGEPLVTAEIINDV